MPFGTKVAYKGYTLKSKHEYAWAHYFETRRIPWEYEPMHFGAGYKYTPDFRVYNRDLFVEVKSYSGVLKNRITRCPHPLIIIFGLPERCYMHVMRSGSTGLESGHSLSWDQAVARLT